MYADDTFLVMDGREKSVREAISIFKRFENLSGLKINVEKTQVIKLGPPPTVDICPYLNIPYSKNFKLLGIIFSSTLENMEELNYSSKITAMQNIINFHQRCTLSMAGRITITKMLLLPKIVHILSVLPSPKTTYIREINSLFTKFIWNNKRPKVQANLMSQDYSTGGLKMLNLNSFCRAAKIKWVKRLYNAANHNSWKILAKTILEEKHIEMVFEGSNAGIKDILKKINNIFWKEVIESWVFFKKDIAKLPEHVSIPNTVIWNSTLIKNENLILSRNKYMDNGMIYLKDLYDYEKGEFRSKDDILHTYNLNVNYFEYLCLIQSIPKNIKTLIGLYDVEKDENCIHFLCSKPKLNKYLYKEMIINLPYDIKCKRKWNEILNTQIDDNNWKLIFNLAKNTSFESKTSIFQYKILHRILPTNALLHKYQIRNDPFCSRCNNVIENLEHLFHTCPLIIKLWYDIADWLSPELDIAQCINSESILLGIYSENKQLENCILLIIKRYIYIYKCTNKDVSIKGAQYFIQNIMNVEVNFNSLQHRRDNILKWSPIEHKIVSI